MKLNKETRIVLGREIMRYEEEERSACQQAADYEAMADKARANNDDENVEYYSFYAKNNRNAAQHLRRFIEAMQETLRGE